MHMERENALEGKSFKEFLSQEKDKLKNLSFRQKLQYIWAYYKIVFAGILLLVVVISIIVSAYKNSKIEELLYIAAVDTSLDGDTTEFIEGFKEAIDFDEKSQSIVFDGIYISESMDSEYEMNSQMKMTTMVAAKQMDIMLIGKDASEEKVKQGYYLDLREALPAELLDLVEPYLVEGYDEERDRTITYGILVDDNEKMNSRDSFYYDDTVLAIVANTERLDMVISFIEYLFE